MSPVFKHYDLQLVIPDFSSPLTDLIIELDYLRKKRLTGSTPLMIFFQLKNIFHALESIGSARIEGNNTTIAEYIETKLSGKHSSDASIIEIQNMEKAMAFIDDTVSIYSISAIAQGMHSTEVKDRSINRAFVSELHKKVVADLPPPPDGEGDRTPGVYRNKVVAISKSEHKPPEHSQQIDAYMDELFAFINKKDEPKYDLLKVSITHHRFLWIHPFTNGNGRTVRLLTYAMLVKQGFNVNTGRILNPTAVFCNNRDNYYHYLALADSGKRDDVLSWCEYVLKGLKEEIKKIDRLLDYDYLKKEILIPTIDYSQERQHITELEAKILKKAFDKKEIRANDLKEFFPGKYPSEISRNIKRLRDKKMLAPARIGLLAPVQKERRKYIISFNNNFLLRGIIEALGKKGFLPVKD